MRRFMASDGTRLAQTQATYWDSLAGWYARAYNDSWSEREDRKIGDLISGWIDPQNEDIILDLGCGQGLAANLFDTDRFRLVGLDISSEMLSFFDRGSNRQIVRGDILRVPLADASVAGIISIFGSLSYVGDIDIALSEMRRVLKRGAPYLIMVLSQFALDRIIHFNVSSEGLYGSQGAPGPGVPARFYTRRLCGNLHAHGLDVHRVMGIAPWRGGGTDFLEGVNWKLGSVVCGLVPEFGHAMVFLGRKRVGCEI